MNHFLLLEWPAKVMPIQKSLNASKMDAPMGIPGIRKKIGSAGPVVVSIGNGTKTKNASRARRRLFFAATRDGSFVSGVALGYPLNTKDQKNGSH